MRYLLAVCILLLSVAAAEAGGPRIYPPIVIWPQYGPGYYQPFYGYGYGTAINLRYGYGYGYGYSSGFNYGYYGPNRGYGPDYGYGPKYRSYGYFSR